MALTSDLSDPRSYVNQVADEKLIALVKDFNFDADGNQSYERLVQSEAAIELTTQAYAEAMGTSASAEAQVETETEYYEATINELTSLEAFLDDDRIVEYVITAYGLDEDTSTDTLRAVLKSDTTDEYSTASKLGENYKELANAFNFTINGTIAREPSAAQTSKVALSTVDLYNHQMMEINAGTENEGVRLALYFQRKASGISGAYDILADKALREVVRVGLGLPTSFSESELEVQARVLENKLDFDSLKNSDYVETFLAQFAALYDMENSAATDMTAATTLFGGTEAGISQDLLYSALTTNSWSG
jgi:hypothetical protein